MSHLKRAREVFDVELAAVKAVRGRLNATFDKAVALITYALANRNKLVVVGVGKSGNIGRKIAATFTSTGAPAVLLDSVDALHGDLGILNDGDIVLALSYSGETDELIDLLPAMKRFSVRVIAITSAPKSTLGQHADVVLNVKVPKEACPFNMAPTASTTASLVMGDALSMAVLDARGFKKSDFAQRHPSGAIGRALLLRVGDIMRSGSRNPIAHQTMPVRDALLIMGEAKSGSVSVVNKNGKLAGVFTDGDLRRHLAKDDDVLDLPLAKVMTRRPTTIREDALAADAIRIFNERNIDDLIVVNAKREPIGLVDSQDLPKLKAV
ncbi:MAG TPA: KpsF/GutQ family sugar-phosphate isomerase [Verrucomicrobiales bacterium]|nr:KpsF/GutQ family sugar-phosphate isomerase [Verrucomicrobiales bacterium]|tara:strand:- start:1555 stop:2526 length:972 start_codon:yes stop_codon:yes gene_type:complete